MKKIILFSITFILVLLLLYIPHIKNKENNIIRFSSWGSQSETAILKNIIKEYEKKYGIRIEFIHIPQNYFQKIQLLFASGLEPDVIFINNQNIRMYIKANLLEDLSPYINTNDFYDEALNCFKYKDGIYAIPRDISTLVLYYNKKILKESKINIEEKLKDLKTFTEILKKLHNENHFSINYETDSLFWTYYLASTGGGILSDDGKNLIINNEKSIAAIKLYTDLINLYKVMPSKGQIGSKTTAQMFINEELAMYLGGRWMVPKFREVINFDWDIMEFPSSDNNKLYADASGWAISKNSKNKKAAIEFIKFISNENSLKELAKTGLIIPANKKAAEWTINNDKNKAPAHSEIFIKMLKNTKPTPVNENYASINDIIKERIELVFSGKQTPEKAFDEKTIKKLESLIK